MTMTLAAQCFLESVLASGCYIVPADLAMSDAKPATLVADFLAEGNGASVAEGDALRIEALACNPRMGAGMRVTIS